MSFFACRLCSKEFLWRVIGDEANKLMQLSVHVKPLGPRWLPFLCSASHSNVHSLRLTSFLSAVENEKEKCGGEGVKRDWCMISNYTPIRRASLASSLDSWFLISPLHFSLTEDNGRLFLKKKKHYKRRNSTLRHWTQWFAALSVPETLR